MGEPATPIRRRLELTVAEARLRFQQLVRVTGLTNQVTVIVDGGRPIAAIVPVGDVADFESGPRSGAVPSGRPSTPSAPPARPGAASSAGAPHSRSSSAPESRPLSAPPARSSSLPDSRPPSAPHSRSLSAPESRPSSAPPVRPAAPPAPAASSAGWLQRIERVREDVRRQHAGRIRELSGALEEAWRLIDATRPPGTDRAADTLRAAHADLRRAG
ncbi:hypothetical protein [Actinoplanes rectilineatus]|uniref:hypothetical protein n=1 Tax=Actinoplanes rectilineatus TaxID=113571 RepID=UPI0005F2A285|nr:hypothetical protein [Actinoplanes rectilineatus]